MPFKGDHGEEKSESRKLPATDEPLRKFARDNPRSRLFSDSTDELPKGILKKSRFPTKRSASECVDDLSQIMADLQLNINDLPKATSKFCLRHQYFDEADDDDDDDDDEENDGYNEEEEDDDEDDDDDDHIEADEECKENGKPEKKQVTANGAIKTKKRGSRTKCDCEINYGDNDEKPKKSVRFDERVYELKFASKLYDRRSFAKYRFSSRHHPPGNNNQQNVGGKSKRNRHNNNNSSKTKGKNEHGSSSNNTGSKSENQNIIKQTKSQRAKQSKRDKKKLHKRDSETSNSSGSGNSSCEDQGYCSSIHNLSD